MALEVCSSFSPIGLNAAVKNNTAIKMTSQQEIKTSLTAVIFERDSGINRIDEKGNIY